MKKKSRFHYFVTGLVFVCSSSLVSAQSADTGPYWPLRQAPGKSNATLSKSDMKLKNQLIEAVWSIKDNRLQFISFTDLKEHHAIDFSSISAFTFETSLSDKFDSKDFVVTSTPELVNLAPQPTAPRVADHIPGKAFRVTLTDKRSGMVIKWQAELRDGANYIRQVFSFSRPEAVDTDTLTRIVMLRLPVAYSKDNSIGTVPGSPYFLPATNIIAGIEEPAYLAVADPTSPGVTELSMPMQLAVGTNDQYQISTMIGSFPAQQQRRTFQYYIERERASRSRAYLHYNAWYDLGFGLSQTKLINVVNSYNEELVKKRGIKIDGFVLDDGWDNPNVDLWNPDPRRFKDGFSGLKDYLSSTSGARLGLWISPFGGYGGHDERLALAKKAGALPANAGSFDMGYPGYYELFKQICLKYINTYGMNYFKWDNAAPFENDGRTFGNLKSTGHFMRLCQLAGELHRVNPDLFINATVGTWPSPFWLNYVDCTWRMGGADVSWIGKGDNREKGMNFRDGMVYKMVVQRAPLYPLNSMMFHGVVLGHKFQAEKTSLAGNNMTNEFRSYFALGVNLQELYLSPDLMNDKAWDDLADCVRWNKKHAVLLRDSHWVEGDPGKGQPYSFASWRNNEGAICFRNPDDTDRVITIDIARAFELPTGAPQDYQLTAAYADQRLQKMAAKGGTPLTITLKPFEVLVFDATPYR